MAACYHAVCFRTTEPDGSCLARVNSLRVFDRSPHFTLLFPVERLGDGPDVGFFDWVAAFDGVGQEQDFFLDVGGEIVHPHDLRHAGRGDLAVVSQFGLVDDRAVLDQSVTAVWIRC